MASEPLGPGDRTALHAHLVRVSSLAASDLAVLAGARAHTFARGTSFLQAGDRAVDCGIILAGVMREYYPLADGREVNRNFAGPGDGVGSLSDLISGEPAKSSVMAETDARVAVFPWSVLRDAAQRMPAWSRFVASITERLYLAKARREYELLALDAEARYVQFRKRFAALENDIALRQVASYVGITPEHLSRLRRRMADARAE
jgi:CRP-like cAMP-binding protein